MKNIDRTYGEKRTRDILSKLPYNKFYCFDEPRIDGPTGTTRYPDFIVVVLSKGVLAVEVKDWKRIDIGKSDQETLRIITPHGEPKFVTNPFKTAKKYSYNLMDLFEKRRELLSVHRGLEKLRFPCEGIVILTHYDVKTIKKMEDIGIFPINSVFPGESLVNTENFICYVDKIIWTWRLKQPLSDNTLEIIKKTIGIKDVRSEKSQIKLGDLNKYQEQVVFAPLPSRDGGFTVDLIRGSVGSGKTIVLIKRAELLADCRPELNILVTAFQIDLTNDLRKRIKNKSVKVMKFFDICREILGNKWPRIEDYRDGPGPALIKNWIKGWEDCIQEINMNVEIVSQEIARRKDLSLKTNEDYFDDVKIRKESFSKDQIEVINSLYELYCEYQENSKVEGMELLDYEDIPDLTLRALFGHKLERSFDVIMIDEAQDWAPKWIQIIKRLLKPGGYLMLCDDPAQSLWRFFNWEQKGIKNPNYYFLELPERTTCQIMTCAQSLFDIDERLHVGYDMDVYPVKTDHLLQGEKPKVIIYKDINDEIAGISTRIAACLSKGTPNSEIGILCANRDDSYQWKNNPIIVQNQIYVGHFNLMKGLEFNTVIIPHLSHSFKSNDYYYENDNHIVLRKLFVAITRAKKSVIMSTYGDFPECISPMLTYTTVEKQA